MKLKYIILFIGLVGTHLAIKAQVINNLVAFCNDSRFTLILNGVKMNEAPLTNVRVEGLDLKVYEVKVIFENKKLKDHSTILTFFRTGKECVFALNKHGKKHTLDYVSEKDIDGFLPPPVYTETPVNTNSDNQTQTNNTNTTTVNNPVTPESQLQTTISNIIAQPTEEGKLKAALASLEKTTFSIAQIKHIFTLFSSEQSRLAFAKQVCSMVKDPSTYTPLVDAFVNEAIKDVFKAFIAGKK
jgi:hypothetical protein